MSKPLLVHQEITIHAPASKVWEVLVSPVYIKQWDDLPEDYGNEQLTLGSVIDWAGYSKLTVVEYEPNHRLRFSLYVPKWPLPADAYHIGYTYTLSQQDDKTLLSISIGDFAVLDHGESYYEESVKFGNMAAQTIKQLAEKLT